MILEPKKVNNGQLKEMIEELTDEEADRIFENPAVQEFLRRRGKI